MLSSSHATTHIPRYTGRTLLGLLPDLLRDTLGVLCAATQHGPVVALADDVVLVTTPDAAQEVLMQPRRFQRNLGQTRVAPIFGDGLISVDGESWLARRRLMQPAFNQRKLAALHDTIVAATEAVCRDWAARDGQPISITADFARLTFRVISEMLFGDNLGEAAEIEVQQAIDDFFSGIQPYLPRILGYPARRVRRALARIDAHLYALIARRRQAPPRDDLLGALLAARDADTGEMMSDRQIRDELMTLLVTGHETTATALAWACCLLAQHPDALARVRAEVNAVVGDREVAMADLAALTYTSQVLHETLRLYPAAWQMLRWAVEPATICGYEVAAGTKILISPYVIHRSAACWPQPEHFDPDRFAAAQPGRRRFAFFPFGAGQHQCLGMRLAMMEAQIILAMVVRAYDIEIENGPSIRPHPGVTLRPSGAIRARMAARSMEEKSMARLRREDVSSELDRIARMPARGASTAMDDARAEQERANALGRILDLVPPDLLPTAIAVLATLPSPMRCQLMERFVDRARKAAAPAILGAVLALPDASARIELLEELARKLPRQSVETAADVARAALPPVESVGGDAKAEIAALFQQHLVADVLLALARRADTPGLRHRLAREARDLALKTPLALGSWQLRALTRASLLLPPDERAALQDTTIDIALRGEFAEVRPESQAMLLSVIAGKLHGPARRRILRLLPQFSRDHQIQIRAGLSGRRAL